MWSDGDYVKRRRVSVTLLLLGLALYILLFAPSLGHELVVDPQWTAAVPPSDGPAPGATTSGGVLTGFRLGDRFGYVDSSGRVALTGTVDYGLALSDSAYVNYSRQPSVITVRDPNGIVVEEIDADEYPALAAGHVYLFSDDLQRVEAYGRGNDLLWSHEFPAVVTAMVAGNDYSVFGLLNGRIIEIGRDGAVRSDVVPTGAHNDVIYSLASSADGSTVAAIAGLSPQILHLFSRDGGALRETDARVLKSDFRRNVLMSFVDGASLLGFETGSGLGIYNIRSRQMSVARLDQPVQQLPPARIDGLLIAGGSNGGTETVSFCLQDGRTAMTARYGGSDFFLDIRKESGSIIFGKDRKLFQIELGSG